MLFSTEGLQLDCKIPIAWNWVSSILNSNLKGITIFRNHLYKQGECNLESLSSEITLLEVNVAPGGGVSDVIPSDF